MSEGLTPRDALEELWAWVESSGETEHEARGVLLALIERDEHAVGQPAPAVYATLAGERAKTPSEAIAAELSSALGNVQAQMRMGVSKALVTLYNDALRDGFVQGVAAECARRDENGGGDG